jgi:hypothetical protein
MADSGLLTIAEAASLLQAQHYAGVDSPAKAPSTPNTRQRQMRLSHARSIRLSIRI